MLNATALSLSLFLRKSNGRASEVGPDSINQKKIKEETKKTPPRSVKVTPAAASSRPVGLDWSIGGQSLVQSDDVAEFQRVPLGSPADSAPKKKRTKNQVPLSKSRTERACFTFRFFVEANFENRRSQAQRDDGDRPSRRNFSKKTTSTISVEAGERFLFTFFFFVERETGKPFRYKFRGKCGRFSFFDHRYLYGVETLSGSDGQRETAREHLNRNIKTCNSARWSTPQVLSVKRSNFHNLFQPH